MNKRDYYNYFTYVFENPLINDYYFSRGIFTPLNQKYELNQNDEYEMIDSTELFSGYGEAIPSFIETSLNPPFISASISSGVTGYTFSPILLHKTPP